MEILYDIVERYHLYAPLIAIAIFGVSMSIYAIRLVAAEKAGVAAAEADFAAERAAQESDDEEDSEFEDEEDDDEIDNSTAKKTN